ncbi:MAG: V-type ATP synthase subunit E [Thermoplasmata archaeon]
MSLDRLVEEIRQRGASELAKIQSTAEADRARLAADRDRRVAEIREQTQRTTAADIARDRAQRLAAAHLLARKATYEASERRLQQSLGEVRELLRSSTADPAYPKLLERMVARASQELGDSARIRGRAEDAPTLSRIAGARFDPTPEPILGGIVGISADGRRRLTLSFDELLRLREDRVRELLA